jgi:TPR repeat protein
MDCNNSNILNDTEIDKLKIIFKNKCNDSFINNFSRKIYNLFVNGITFEPGDGSNGENNDESYYLGVYYNFIKINYDLMKKYYLMAIDKGRKVTDEATSAEAMNNLGMYYRCTEYDYDLTEKYYLMAIEKGCIEAMNNLGTFYKHIVKNYALAKKYYLMAFDKGNVTAMYELGNYYQFNERNNDLAKKFYIQAIDKGNTEAMFKLGYYYQCTEKNYDLMIKYYLMAIEKRYSCAAYDLIMYSKYEKDNYDLTKKYFLFATKNGCDCFNIFCNYYITQTKTCRKDMLSILLAMIEGKINFSRNIREYFYSSRKYTRHFQQIAYNLIISTCQVIDNNELCIDDFKFYCEEIINFIQTNKVADHNFRGNIPKYDITYINYFIKYISIMYYNKNGENKKKYIRELLKKSSQLFMEYLDFRYYKYLEIKFAPGGEEYKKIETHFKSIANVIINKK